LADLPSDPNSSPVKINILSNSNTITVNMAQVTNDNGSKITEYNLQMYEEFSSNYKDISKSFQTTITVSNLKRGSFYIFRYRVKNAVGYSGFSTLTKIRDVDVPGRPEITVLNSISKEEISIRFNQNVDTEVV
jgi:hypothetical protein